MSDSPYRKQVKDLPDNAHQLFTEKAEIIRDILDGNDDEKDIALSAIASVVAIKAYQELEHPIYLFERLFDLMLSNLIEIKKLHGPE